jgi:hypothetical protein
MVQAACMLTKSIAIVKGMVQGLRKSFDGIMCWCIALAQIDSPCCCVDKAAFQTGSACYNPQ